MQRFLNRNLAEFELLVNSITSEGEPTDIYKVKAAEMFGVKEDKVTPEQRRLAKIKNYTELYGG